MLDAESDVEDISKDIEILTANVGSLNEEEVTVAVDIIDKISLKDGTISYDVSMYGIKIY